MTDRPETPEEFARRLYLACDACVDPDEMPGGFLVRARDRAVAAAALEREAAVIDGAFNVPFENVAILQLTGGMRLRALKLRKGEVEPY